MRLSVRERNMTKNKTKQKKNIRDIAAGMF